MDEQTILDRLPTPVIISDGVGAVNKINSQAAIEFNLGDTAKATVGDILSKASRVILQTHVYPTLLRAGEISEFYCRAISRHGDDIPVYVDAKLDVNGDRRQIVWVFYIGRERAKFEKELISTREGLQNRTAELQELAKSHQGLALEREKQLNVQDRFISILAHDLRSPFNVLLGMTEHLAASAERMPVEKIKSGLGDIHTAANSAYNLVDELLAWSGAQAKEAEPQKTPTDISALIEESIAPLVSVADEKGVALKNEVIAKIVSVDRDIISLVVRNLVSNAIKFTPEGGRVALFSETRDDWFRVCISDTGVGLDPSVATSIFSIDIKTTTLGTSGEQGTGLGLPLCKQFMTAHEGVIGFEPNAEGGTCFYFEIYVEKFSQSRT